MFDRFGFGQEPFISSNCPVSSCYVTDDRRLLPSLSQFDAILFHARDMDRRVIQVREELWIMLSNLASLLRFQTRRGENRIKSTFSF